MNQRNEEKLKHLEDRLAQIEARLEDMNTVYNHCLDCHNTTDAIHIRLQMAPLLVKKRSLKERIYNLKHPHSQHLDFNLTINNQLLS